MDLGVFKLGIFDGHFDREKPWEPMVFHHDPPRIPEATD